MKTIEQISKEAIQSKIKISIDDIKEDYHEMYISNAVHSCQVALKELQRWIPVEEELPCCFEDGVWDGLRSEWVLVKDSFGEWHKARLYSGTMDGQQFNAWYDERDYELRNIISWRPIERR